MIDWSKQHCGVLQAPIKELNRLMPEVGELIASTFPDDPAHFTWDVKVHMLMPMQYPCIPNWHCDAIPRVNGIQQFDKVRPKLPLYLWISGPPLTQFEGGYLQPCTWHRFNQLDKHRGVPADDFCWRGFIRAIHHELQPPRQSDFLRRHTQVYVDAANYLC